MAKAKSKRAARKPSMIASVSSGILGKLHELDEQRRSLLAGAKDEALAAAKAAVAALNSLGFNYELSQGRSGKIGSRVGTRKVKEAPCPICNFQTSPPHDRRAHRSQKDKKPFTAAELQAKGLSKA
jgi:hypothetical protein